MFDHDRPDADGIDPEFDDDDLPAVPVANAASGPPGRIQG